MYDRRNPAASGSQEYDYAEFIEATEKSFDYVLIIRASAHHGVGSAVTFGLAQPLLTGVTFCSVCSTSWKIHISPEG